LTVAIAGVFFFGYRVGMHAHHFRRQTDPIRAWMNVPFIAHSHHVPPEILFDAAKVPPERHDRRSLRKIARDQKRPVEDVIHDVEKAVAAARKSDAERKAPLGNVP
jgi:hypothetical protein